jgi:hypothetical protein
MHESQSPSPASGHLKEAVDILRATDDGDELDGADLALLQDVVNSRGSCLSERGGQYWAALHQSATSGSYVKRWFCGIKNLTRDAQGYVYWRGKQVEHYSYQPEHRAKMIAAARILASVCTRIESSGEQVTGSAVSRTYREMDFGNGVQMPRYLVKWVVGGDGPQLAIDPLQLSTLAESKAEVDGLVTAWRELKSGFDSQVATQGGRHFVVVSREDYDQALAGMCCDIDWVARARAQRCSFYPSEAKMDVQTALRTAIPRESLALRAQIESDYLPDLARLTAESAALLAADPLTADADTQRPAERMSA